MVNLYEHIDPAYIVLTIIGILFILIYKEYIKPAIGFLLGVLVFVVLGILETSEALAGFSNSSIASILLLIMIVAGIRKNFQVEDLFDYFFRTSGSYKSFLARMMAFVATFSSIIPNTPIVALMIPYVYDYGLKKNISPSKLLIPLSFAAIMGGMITVIGTSTTMVLNGFITKQGLAGLDGTSLFITGVLVSLIGIIAIAYFLSPLLPDHGELIQKFTSNQREYIFETRLIKGSELVNKSVQEANLRNLEGFYLVEIIRHGKSMTPVDPNEILEEDDELIFAGDMNNIIKFITKHPGLELPEKTNEYHKDKNEVIEAIISGNSGIIGKTVKQSGFRQRYDAAIVAVQRNGERISGKIGDIILQASDVLLLYTGKDFQNRVDTYKDVFVISQIREIAKPGNKKFYALGLIILCALILFITKGLELFPSLLIIFSIMVGFGLINSQDVRRELDLNLVGLLVFSLAIGEAMIKTGAGRIIADWMIDLLQPFGPVGLLVGIILVTNLLTQFLVNVGSISITFPIAYELSSSLGMDGMPFFIGIAFAASGAFLTPIGYQTNLMIFGPGGYTFRDFFRIGIPMALIYNTLVTLILLLLYQNLFFVS